MFRWLHAWWITWNRMFQPTEERKLFQRELEMRTTPTDKQWTSVYEELGRDRTRRIVALIEKSAQSPRNRLLPTDSLDLLFHGTADEDMPFGRFRSDVRREFGIRLSVADIRGTLSDDHQTLHELIKLIVNGHLNI